MRVHRHHGFALLTVMWVLVVLLILVAGFMAMTHSEAEVTRNFTQQASARWAARTGICRAEAQALSLVAQQPSSTMIGPQLVIDGSSDSSTLAGANYTVSLQDEAGKLNINTATADELGVFFTDDVVSNILTWRSANGSANNNAAQGADDAYYTGLNPPYHCKYAPFSTVDELLLVQGVTQAMLTASVTSDGLTLEDVLTASSVDDNLAIDGTARINLNTISAGAGASPGALLQSRLRAFGKSVSLTECNTIYNNRNRLTSPANLLTNPFSISKTTVEDIYDCVTTTADSTADKLKGRINLNTVSPEVLVALPGMSQDIVDQIVQYRSANGPFNSVGQLLSINGVSNQIFANIADLLTVRFSRFRAVVVGQGADGMSQTSSCLLQVEPNNGTPITRILYWHE